MTAAARIGSSRRTGRGTPAPRVFSRMAAATAMAEVGSARMAASSTETGCRAAKPARAICSPTMEIASDTSTIPIGAHRRSSSCDPGTRASGSRMAPSMAKVWKAMPPWL